MKIILPLVLLILQIVFVSYLILDSNKNKKNITDRQFAVVVDENLISITATISGVDTSRFKIGDIVYYGENLELLSAEEYVKSYAN